jgi:HK97 family phage prohead protease
MARREQHDVEVRFAPPSDDGTLEGVAVRFGVVDAYGTTFAASAFAGMEGRTVPMLWSHSPADVMGSWTVTKISPTEMSVRGRLNLDVQRAREARAMIQAGDVSGLSIGFSTLKDERRGTVRNILRATLHEISITAFAAVPGSKVTSIRSDRDGAAVRLAEAARSAVRAITGKATP